MINTATTFICACLASAMSLYAAQAAATTPPEAEPADDTSKAYWHTDLEAQSEPEPREKAVMQSQINEGQVTHIEAAHIIDDTHRSKPIAQLSESDRQIRVNTPEGADICEREERPAEVIELCARRIENRSEEFATSNGRTLSADERLLSESLKDNRANSLAQAIDRLGRNDRDADAALNQVIASVVLGTGQERPAPGDDAEANQDEQQLPPEAGAIVDGAIQELGPGAP